MGARIRLKKTGTKNRAQWRVVVTDRKNARDGRLIEELGFYNPLVDPPEIRIRVDRYQEWLRKGARPSEVVRGIAKQAKVSL